MTTVASPQLLTLSPDATLADLPTHDVRVPGQMPTQQVDRLLRQRDQLPGLLLFHDQRYLGMISRAYLCRFLEKRFVPDFFLTRPIIALYEHIGVTPLRLAYDTTIHEAVSQALARPEPDTFEPVVVDAEDGSPRLMELQTLLSGQSQLLMQRIAAHESTMQALHAAEEKYRGIFDHTVEGIFQSTADGRVLSGNPALARLMGYESMHELRRCVTDIREQIYADPSDRDDFARQLQSEPTVRGFETQLVDRHGRRKWVSMNGRAIRDDDGQVLYFEGTIEDITERKRMEQKLRDDARHDSLTGLPNRSVLMEELTAAVTRLRTDPSMTFALMFLDFDHFKLINDSLGHACGDLFLQKIAERLRDTLADIQASTPVCEQMLAARIGGDEFTVLMQGPAIDSVVEPVAVRLQRALSKPYELQGHEVFSSASIGVVTSDLELDAADQYIRDADIAMYRAKDLGKGRHVLFNCQMRDELLDQVNLGNDLRRAIERGEMRIYYQPMVSLERNELIGFEALLRWAHPTRGLLSPSMFIRAAEELGIVHEIGWWSLQQVCERLAQWRRDGKGTSNMQVTLNISPRQLFEPNWVRRLQNTLREHDIPPSAIALELSETSVVDASPQTQQVLDDLRAMGMTLWLDDFGTGYSSLYAMKQYPVDALKLDRRFLQDLNENRDYLAITQAVVGLAHNLGMKVIAEGLERADQLPQLLSLDIDYAQGYLFSPPVEEAEAQAMLGKSGSFYADRKNREQRSAPGELVPAAPAS